MIFLSSVRASAQPQEMEQNLKRVFQTGSLYEQPIDPNGKLLLSSRLDPDGSDYDEFIWDDFLLPAGGTITAIDWYGGYDPLKFGKGGPVMDFTVRIYPSIAAGTEPAIANPPLVEYQTGGNANETAFGTVNGAPINVYSFILPVPFEASANIKYWVFIVASQTGLIPDWCFISGTGGSGYRYIKTSGAGGDTMYRFMPGDAAFELLGQVPDPMTPTPTVTVTSSPSNTPAPTMTPTNTPPTPTPVPQIPTCFNSIAIPLMLAVFLPGFPLAKRRDTNK
jgi:hypothetical protein